MVIGKFHLKKKLGSGHFSEVWLAVDMGLNTEYAVKFIPKDKIVNQGNFFYEAQILKAAQHANIVQVLDTGNLPDGRIYLSMEYLKKGNLANGLKGQYIPLTKAKKLMIDVLRGLEYIHLKGIVHRDIKPANILIGNSLEGKLSDFGLALQDINSLKLDQLKDYKYRKYLAPEVRTARDYSPLSDIFASGVTLYHLVNGDDYFSLPPFELLKQKMAEGNFPNRDKYREFVPRQLRLLINKAMHLNPVKRFQKAEEMRRALEQVKIEKNWSERLLENGIKWSCGWDDRCYEVERIKISDDKWTVNTKKGSSKYCLRAIGKLCFKNIPQKEALKKASKILQGFVSGESVF
jgi:serine/threonine protein kinase